ncbi:MAG: chorismate mutase [Candidatus Saccharimonadales bacterium]
MGTLHGRAESEGPPDTDEALREELTSLRGEIDADNLTIVAVLGVRMQRCKRVGEIKAELGEEICVPEREREVLEDVVAANEGSVIPEEGIREIFSGILSVGRSVQRDSRA